MSEKWESETTSQFVKSPWLGVPITKPAPSCHVEEWFSYKRPRNHKLYFFDLERRRPVGNVAVLWDEADESLEDIFRTLVSEWKEHTWSVSSIKKRISHPAFMKIIGLGPPAVPLILEELRREPDYWSYALEAITREDPAPRAENLQQLRDAWLAWGQARAY